MITNQRKKELLKVHDAWWQQKGGVFNLNVIQKPTVARDFERYHLDAQYGVDMNIIRLENKVLYGDALPMAMVDYGTVTLAAYLGSKQVFGRGTIWYEPTIEDMESREKFVFDEKNQWWQIQKGIVEGLKPYEKELIIGAPGFSHGLDTLAALRGAEDLMIDLIDCPELVHEALDEMDDVYYPLCDNLYGMLKDDLGATGFGYFELYGTGKTTQLQCDNAAMLSPKMYDEFVTPTIQKASQYFENTMYHVDGTQCLSQVEQLLAIPELKAIEWTPQAGIESGGDKRWYPLYRQILEAGKSVQVVGIEEDQLLPLIDAIGHKGVYFTTSCIQSEKRADELLNEIAKII